jgi:toxin ParE1/3/4
VSARRRKGAPAPLPLVWTDRALNDLEDIGDYIAADDPVAAERWVGELMRAAEQAASAPLSGRRVPELGRDDVREVFKRTYRIVYRVRPDRVDILAVFEGHQRLPGRLKATDSGAERKLTRRDRPQFWG